MTWWCSAQGLPWTWSWQAYPGAWLMVAALASIWWRARLRVPEEARTGYALAGLLAFWIAVDWPVGALGAGYLLSAHQLQYVLIVMVAPPLLLLAMPRTVLDRWRTAGGAAARWITHPVVALLVCNAIIAGTHFPGVVDGIMTTQLGSFFLDMSWFGAGLILWWPVVTRLPSHPGLGYGGRIAYLLVATIIPGVPALFFFFADYPLYALYELAPPIGWLSAIDDQFLAGAIMKLGSFAIIVIAMSILFYRWHLSEGDRDREIVLPPLQFDGPRPPASGETVPR